MIETKLFRQKLLDLAIRGQLVPQDPNDEPASVLLERIREEKKKLVKAGKIKAEKTESSIFRGSDKLHYETVGGKTRCIEDEIPFEIPESWAWVRLGNFTNIIMGQSPDGNSVGTCNSGIEFHQGKIFFSERFLRYSEQKTSAPKKIVYANSVLISVRAPVGAINITDRQICIGRGLAGIVLFQSLPKELLFFFLLCFANDFNKKATGSTFAAITGDVLKNQLFPLPPLAEQHRIVEKLEAVLGNVDTIDAESKKLEVLAAQSKSKILDLAIRGKLVPQDPNDEPASALLERIQKEKQKLVKAGKIKPEKQTSFIFRDSDNRHYETIGSQTRCIDDEIPFEIPQNWVWVRLGTSAEMTLGKMLDKQKNRGTYEPYLRNINVRWGCFDFTDILEMRFEKSEQARYELQRGDLVICEGGEPGRCAIWKDNTKTIKIQKALHRVRPYQFLTSSYLCYLFFAYTGMQYLVKFFTGSTIKHLTGDSLKRILIPLPPLAEQHRIVAEVEKLLEVCGRL